MCRGFQQNDGRDRLLKIKAFYLRLSVSRSCDYPLPDSLTLHYLPRINGSPLEIDELTIRPDSPGFVTLHRVVAGEKGSSRVLYGSREKVGVGEGVKFEVLLSGDKMVRGFFRKDEGGEWRLELRSGVGVVDIIKAVEVCVAAEGEVVMSEKVEMVVRRRKRRCFEGLEEIPEEIREGELAEEEEEEGCCCCCECRGGSQEVEVSGGVGGEVVAEVEGVRWAVDVGIWVACLGVGCLVSIASSKKLRRKRFL